MLDKATRTLYIQESQEIHSKARFDITAYNYLYIV